MNQKSRAPRMLAASATIILFGMMISPCRADDFDYARRLYLDKAQCAFCHGWAGDGAGEPQSNGGAASLRQSFLNREQLVEVIMCGRPGTPMPRFDEDAYTDKRCYDITEAELGPNTPTLPPGSTLQKRESGGDRRLYRREVDRPWRGDARGMPGGVRPGRALVRPPAIRPKP